MLSSANVSAGIDLATLGEIDRLAASFPIEMAELRASPKQLDFQRSFFERRDPDGRRCDIFVALGGNRSGKSYVCGWLCFAKHLRDRAQAGDTYWCVAQTLDGKRSAGAGGEDGGQLVAPLLGAEMSGVGRVTGNGDGHRMRATIAAHHEEGRRSLRATVQSPPSILPS